MQKSGADAVARALHKICGTVKRYNAKLHAVVAAALVAGVINSDQALAANAFVDAANATCEIWEAIAAFNSITP